MKKILIVDDSPFFRGLLKDGLTRESVVLDEKIEFAEAEDAETALKQISAENPDLVFLDIVMKENEFEGVDTLKKIRQQFPNVKVIMLTSVGQTSVVNKCHELGVLDYISKPFDSLQLVKVVKKHL